MRTSLVLTRWTFNRGEKFIKQNLYENTFYTQYYLPEYYQG
jgi:hypothetical protein